MFSGDMITRVGYKHVFRVMNKLMEFSKVCFVNTCLLASLEAMTIPFNRPWPVGHLGAFYTVGMALALCDSTGV